MLIWILFHVIAAVISASDLPALRAAATRASDICSFVVNKSISGVHSIPSFPANASTWSVAEGCFGAGLGSLLSLASALAGCGAAGAAGAACGFSVTVLSFYIYTRDSV